MREIALIESRDREMLFRNTAYKMGVSEAIIEKDFWVCYVLDYLFHRCKWKNRLSFKGGTSLSKVYGMIKRFSEDIDLILDWRVLGYGINEPWEPRSNTQQTTFNEEANKRAEIFLRNQFLPEISADLAKELKYPVNCEIDTSDRQTVKFIYPNSFSDTAILQEIRLEIGALAAWTPAKEQLITPYAAEYYMRVFKQPSTQVLTVLPERTFWEKVTILHREAYRSEDKPFPCRYSRHYYDLYCMAGLPVKVLALKDTNLLDNVVAFKEKFYRCPWARYDFAKRGSIRLLPPEYNLPKLKDDYKHTQNMIFGDKPEFDTILKELENLEREINS